MTYTKNYTNFALQVNNIFIPLECGSTTSTWQVQLTVSTSDWSQQLLIPMQKVDRLNLEQHSACVYASSQERKQVSEDLRNMITQALSDPSAIVNYPSQSGWIRTPKLLFSAGTELLPTTCNHPAQGYMHLCGEPVHIAAAATASAATAASPFINSLLEQPEYRIPSYSYTITSALRSIWNEVDLPFSSTLYIVGKSGTGKTTLAKNFCQLYNDEAGQIADCYDAKSTVASMQAVLSKVRDRTVLVDDLCRSSDCMDQRQRKASAANLLRFAANEMDRSKLSGKQDIKLSCHAGLVITAEFPLLEASELTRCILLRVSKPRIGGTSKDRELSAIMLKAYLSWFAEHEKQELDNLRTIRARMTTPPRPGDERLWTSVMQLNWCMESFFRFLDSIGCPLERSVNEKFISKIFLDLFKEEQQFILRLQEQSLPFEYHIMKGIKSRLLPGIHHKNSFCVRFDTLVQYLQQTTKRPDVSMRRVSIYLRKNGLVDIDQSKRVTKKLHGQRYAFLNLSQLNVHTTLAQHTAVPVMRPTHFTYNKTANHHNSCRR